MITNPSREVLGAYAFDYIYAKSHKVVYEYTIEQTVYTESHVKGTPVIERMLFDSPAIGVCTTGTLDITVYPQGDIPKAARVKVEYKLVAKDGKSTAWYPLGTFFVSKRKAVGELLNLQCRDSMVKAGRKYLGVTQQEEWPVPSTVAVAEIAASMGVQIDSRTVLDAELTVDYPEDLLMSEVLAMIGSMHGGTFIITPENKLRLVPYPNPETTPVVAEIGKNYSGYTGYSTGSNTITRVTLVDNAGNEFSYGDDDGRELGATCFYATADITQDVYDALKDTLYVPYEISLVYMPHTVELGDAITIQMRDNSVKKLLVGYQKTKMAITCRAAIKFGVDEDDEEEIPYTSDADLRASRSVSTLGTYHGNRINRAEGFVSEYVLNGVVKARLIANSNVFSMSQLQNDGRWKDRIYFDPVSGKYIIDGEVTINALEQINEEIVDKGGQSTSLYEWIHSGEYKMTSQEFNIMLKADADYTTFYDDVMVGEGSVSYKANYVFSPQGFNAKLSDSTVYQGFYDAVMTGEDSISSVLEQTKNTANYVASTAGFNAMLTSDSSYSSFYEDVMGTSAQDTSSIKYKADYVFSDTGFNAKLEGNSKFDTLYTDVEGTGSQDTSTVKYKANYVFSNEGFNAKLTNDSSFTSTATTATSAQTTANSAKSTADYIASSEGFAATLEQNTKFSTLYTDVEGTSEQDTSSVKYKANYVYNADGFNALLQANADYTTQKATITATAGGLSSKVEKGSIISEINQSSESVSINASKINLNGAITANNNVKIGTDGKITAVGGTFTSASVTGSLSAGSWKFDSSGAYFTSGSIRSTTTALSGQSYSDGYDIAEDPSNYRMFFGSSGCDMMYGCQDQNNYAHNMFLRAKRFIFMAGSSNSERAIMGKFMDDEGTGIQFSFFPAEDNTGNLGSSNRRWNTCRFVRGPSSSSSRERKTNIVDLAECGDIIDSLRPVTFTYKDMKGYPDSTGFILEEIYPILPIVCDVENNNFRNGGLFYERFIPYLTKEIQSLRKRVKALEERNE